MKTKNISDDRIQEHANEVANSGWLVAYRAQINTAIKELEQAKSSLSAMLLDESALDESIKAAKRSKNDVEHYLSTNKGS